MSRTLATGDQTVASIAPTADLARFVADLEWADLPDTVVAKAKELLIDWIGSALAGSGAGPVQCFEAFADRMGPERGPAEILSSERSTSAYFAALINAAASHVVEQDDVHNGSVFHPAAVVFPAALAVAQQEGLTGRDLLLAAVAGYETGIRVGEFLGRTHYAVFHTTGTAGTLAAAAAVGKALRLGAEEMNHAFGSAGTQAAGLWEFLRDAADSKQLHTAKAAADGLLAASLARSGFTGARRILEGPQGLAAGMSRDSDPARLTDGLGRRWAILETSLKWHASCRHTHPAADALALLFARRTIDHRRVRSVTARVHQAAIDVLGPVGVPASVHQAKFSMGTVLGLIAVHGKAGLAEFETALDDADVLAFRDKVGMTLDAEVDHAYPRRWIGKIEIVLDDGARLEARVDAPKGDPDNPLTAREVEDKAIRLASFRRRIAPDRMRMLVERVKRIDHEAGALGPLLSD